MPLRLSCTDTVSTLSNVELDSLPVTIGRGQEADICISDSWASRIHCRLSELNGRLRVDDNHSSNGTLVNGRAIESAELRSGDELTIGITTLRVKYSCLPSSADEAARELIRS